MFKRLSKLIGLLAIGTAVFMIAVPIHSETTSKQNVVTTKPIVVKAKKVKKAKKPVKKAAPPKEAQEQANKSGKDKFVVK